MGRDMKIGGESELLRSTEKNGQKWEMSLPHFVRKIQPIKKFISNSVLAIGFLINAFLVFGADNILGTPLSALATEISGATQKMEASEKIDARSIPKTLLDLIYKEQPLPPSPGIIRKISEYRDDRTIAVFCATALNQHGVDHEKFITLIRDELVDQVNEDFGRITGVAKPYFLQSVDRQNIFGLCLGHNLSTSSQETLYRLLQIEWVVNSDKARTYWLLVKLADNGHIPAKYLLANEIFFAASDRSHKKTDEIRKYAAVSADNYHRLLLSVAENGNMNAQMDLVHFYLRDYGQKEWGEDPRFDAGEAIRRLKLLAMQEKNIRLHDAAIELIGYLYYYGTERLDDNIGSNIYRKHENNLEYNHEIVIKIDRHEALRWIKKIPEERLKNTCNAVWMFYEVYRDGDVLEKNKDQANHYLDVFTNKCIKP